MENMSFYQFLKNYGIPKCKAFKLLGIKESPRWLDIYYHGDCIEVNFIKDKQYKSKDIDVRDLNLSV